MENKNHKGKASRVETKISQTENNVHQDLVVMDTDTGKILNYRQLMIKPKYKKNWSTSSENEFVRLENGVDGRIKPPTNKITFIRRKYLPQNCRKYVTYGQSICSVRPDKK